MQEFNAELITNSPKMKTTQVSINGRTAKKHAMGYYTMGYCTAMKISYSNM